MIYTGVVLSLCQSEAAINLQDEEGFTPLMWAAAHGQIAVVEFLLQSVSAINQYSLKLHRV